jgi:eukaryotic-like serine/threonine-protein kinase
MSEISENTVIDGRYRVLHKVGSGGMADVYCAEDTHLGRRVALKLLHQRFAQDTEFVERFRREASSAAGLQHPNVVGVYDRGEFDGTYYIAMEYCEGRSLKQVITAEAPLDPRRAIAITKQMLVAARFAHRRNVIHRDLKPHNVILGADDTVKVTDFGIARAGASDITEAGTIMGTAQYLSPEQAQGRPVTEASDLYSIGVVLFEMLTGRAPFDGDSAVAIALKHVNQPPPSPRQFVPTVPPVLERVAMKALAKETDQRYTDAESFIHDLEAAELRLDGGAVDTESTAVFAPMPLPAQVSPGSEVAQTAQASVLAPAPATIGRGAPIDAEVIEVPPPPGPPSFPREPYDGGRRRWLWALGLLGVAAVALIAFLLFRPANQVHVPGVVGQTLNSARGELEHAGLAVDVRRRANPAPADIVFDQAPNPGQKADDGSTVAVFVSNGPGTVKVPDVIGLVEGDARKRMRAADLRSTVQQESSPKVEKGLVIRTDPSAGRPVDRNTAVTLVVSSGPEQVEVPDVTGQNEEDAIARLRDAGLSAVSKEKASSEPSGTVVSQTPASGQQVDQGTSVTIFVSNGKVKEVPDVTGLTQADAVSQIEDAGFTPAVRTRQTDQPEEDGIVLSQSPRGSSKRRESSTVAITVGALATPAPGASP